MNFLAHLYLSGSDPDLMTGNFIGDFVKGRHLAEKYPTGVVAGIELHRAIDSFTDTHPVVAESKKRLRPTYRHYSGVIVDIYYDHFLAVGWGRFHNELLPDYADHCYDILQKRATSLPEEVQYMLPYMVNGNWLVNYSKTEGIHRALSGMARRTRFNSKMELAVHDLKQYYASFQLEFDAFFPELIEHCDQWRKTHT